MPEASSGTSLVCRAVLGAGAAAPQQQLLCSPLLSPPVPPRCDSLHGSGCCLMPARSAASLSWGELPPSPVTAGLRVCLRTEVWRDAIAECHGGAKCRTALWRQGCSGCQCPARWHIAPLLSQPPPRSNELVSVCAERLVPESLTDEPTEGCCSARWVPRAA